VVPSNAPQVTGAKITRPSNGPCLYFGLVESNDPAHAEAERARLAAFVLAHSKTPLSLRPTFLPTRRR
jgi:hypothetical protein